MAVTWVRGQRCGVNNCSSRFYQVSGGHRVCQNGHVQEGFEATADDDDFAAIGRRIHMPRDTQKQSQNTSASKIVHGREAFGLTLSLMQEVLVAQVGWLRNKLDLDSDYENAVRTLWAAYITHITGSGAKPATVPVSLRDLVMLCYFGLRLVKTPVLLIDMLRWIPLEDFPYVCSQRWLSPEQFERVPIEQRRVFTGLGTPTRLSLHHRALTLRPPLEQLLQVRIVEVDDRFALYKWCRELLLPPEMYIGASTLLRDRHFLPRTKLWSSEDLPAMCALVVATKMAYGLDGLPRVLDEARRGEQINWDVWRDVVRKLWTYQPNPTVADERLALFWDGNAIDSYLSWQQHTILPPDPANDRLRGMFPLDMPPPRYSVVDENTLTELTALVHATRAPQETCASTPNPNEGAGSHYQVFASRREMLEPLPDTTQALYEVIACILNTEEEEVRNIVRGFEFWVRKRYGRLAYDEVHPDEPRQTDVSLTEPIDA